jgi:hypothetical protein
MRGGNMMGSSGGSGGGGIATSSAAGINYSDRWNNHFDVSGNYNFNTTNTVNKRNSYRQNFLPMGTIDEGRNAFSQNQSTVHRTSLRITYTINERNSIIYVPNLTLQNSENVSTDTTGSFGLKNGTRQRLNRSSAHNRYSSEALNWSNNLIWRKTFAKAGRTLAATFSNTHARNTGDGFNRSASLDYSSDGTVLRDSILNQQSTRTNRTDNVNMVLSYTEPVGRDKIWEVNYGYSNNKNITGRQTFDLDTALQKYTVANEALTNDFQNKNRVNRLGTNFRVAKKRYNYQVGVAYVNSVLESNNLSKGSMLKQRFGNLFPTASFNYQFARSRSLRFNYRGATAQPSVSQLQPVPDVTNPRYIREGNPALGQEFRNAFSLNYNFFNVATFRNIFATLSFNNTYNKIVNSTQFIDSFGKQAIRPVNMNGAYDVSANVNMGFPIRRMQGGNFNTTTSVSYNREPNLVNGLKSYAKNLTIGENLRLNYNHKEKLDLGINAGISYTAARYTIQQQQREAYMTHNYGIDATWVFGKGFILSSDFDVMANTGRSAGFNQSIAMWNAALAKEVFKNKRGELRASVFDILNNNRSLVRNVGETYIEDVETTVLKRFFMLSFTYKVNRMASKRTGK